MLLLMAKQPVPGRTKTRLSPPLTEQEAAELYRAFLQDKVAQMRHFSNVRSIIAYTPAEGRGFFEQLAPGFALIEQEGETLGQRLVNVFDWAFAEGPTRVLAIDGDTPTLPPAYLQQGFEALEDPDVDVVLGPSADGGYYAIGMKQPHPILFEVTMSTPHVARDTLARAKEAGLEVHRLPPWWDVDRPEDLKRLAMRLRAGGQAPGFAAEATRRLLTDDIARFSGPE